MARTMIDGVSHRRCDYCKNDFTVTNEPHITLDLGVRSGISGLKQRGLLPGWRFLRIFRPNLYDFCVPKDANDNCVSKFFYALSADDMSQLAEYVIGY